MDKSVLTNIDLSKVKKEYVVLTCVILMLLIGYVAYKNVFTSLLKDIRQVSSQIKERQSSIQKARISPQAFQKLENEFAEIKAKIDEYHILESEADIPQILQELNQMAEQLQIRFISVNPLDKKKIPLPESEESVLQIPIRIKLQCGYHQLGIFINQLENSTRFMKITGLNINADSKDIWRHNVELEITSFSLTS